MGDWMEEGVIAYVGDLAVTIEGLTELNGQPMVETDYGAFSIDLVTQEPKEDLCSKK